MQDFKIIVFLAKLFVFVKITIYGIYCNIRRMFRAQFLCIKVGILMVLLLSIRHVPNYLVCPIFGFNLL